MRTIITFAAFFCLPMCMLAAGPGLVGDWREPGGSVIRIAPCGQDLCAALIRISAQAPSQFDIHNPDAGKRNRPLCGLQIGSGFHPDSSDHADGGTLYDPKSGKTYHGEMTVHGNRLDLRGYVGLKMFGRTESWTRTQAGAACEAPMAPGK